MRDFLLAFLPLFVAIDVVGVLPVFLALTERLTPAARRRLAGEATATAFAISVVFLLAGDFVFAFLGITASDFRVGGGILLLVFAVRDLLAESRAPADVDESLGVVPLGTPLVMGPAALTTIVILVDSVGYGWTLVSLCTNLVLAWTVLARADAITRVIGRAGARAVARLISVFLAGIAVMMIRSGVIAMLRSGPPAG